MQVTAVFQNKSSMTYWNPQSIWWRTLVNILAWRIEPHSQTDGLKYQYARQEIKINETKLRMNKRPAGYPVVRSIRHEERK